MIFTVISLALAIKRCIDLSKNQQRNLFMKILLIFFNIWGAYHYPIIYSLITSFIMFYVKKEVTIVQDFPQIYNQFKNLVQLLKKYKQKLNAVMAQIKKNEYIIQFSENVSDKYRAIKQNENLIKLSKILSEKIEQLTNYISKKDNLTK